MSDDIKIVDVWGEQVKKDYDRQRLERMVHAIVTAMPYHSLMVDVKENVALAEEYLASPLFSFMLLPI